MSYEKIGFQTIVWGPRLENLEYILDVIASAGYKGVEFMQRLKVLRDIDYLLKALEKRDLKLICLTGDSLEKRIEFCQGYRPDYLYLDNWEKEIALNAMEPKGNEKGFTLGLHPHVYMPIHRIADALKILDEYPHNSYPHLKFIPDTAHISAFQDNPAEIIRNYINRVIAIHFKDWSSEFGRTRHRYARGFMELGQGEIDFNSILQVINDSKNKPWIVVEQDYTRTDPETSTFAGAMWLFENGLLKDRPKAIVKRTFSIRKSSTCSDEKENRFLQVINRAGAQNLTTCYKSIAKAFNELIDCQLIQVWCCNQADYTMTLLTSWSQKEIKTNRHILKWNNSLSGTAIERQAVCQFDLNKESNKKKFALGALLNTSKSSITKMISVPVLSPWNPHHVRLIINIFPKDDFVPISDDDLFRLSEYISLTSIFSLEDTCSTSAAKINQIAGKSKNVKNFLKVLVNNIHNIMNSEGSAIFLVNDLNNKLELRDTTGTSWNVSPEEKFYRKGEGLTGSVWKKAETLISSNASKEPKYIGKSKEGRSSSKPDACIIVPLMKPSGKVIGVIRCRNRNARKFTTNPNNSYLFSDDDAAILETIAQATIPHLEVLLSQERRIKALGKLTHELTVPLVAIRGAVEFMQKTKGIDSFFDHDYAGDIWAWSELMKGLLDNLDLVRFNETITLRAKRTYLLKEIVSPAVKQVEMILRERHFSSKRISRGYFTKIPQLWIDQTLFHRVFFNLLSNAIKYCYKDPSSFRVEIEGDWTGAGYQIYFRDWGPGIDPGMEEEIFHEAVRGPNAIYNDVAGQGLGLWFVQRIIEAHNGKVTLTSNHLPTEFTIYLPGYLAHHAPFAKAEMEA